MDLGRRTILGINLDPSTLPPKKFCSNTCVINQIIKTMEEVIGLPRRVRWWIPCDLGKEIFLSAQEMLSLKHNISLVTYLQEKQEIYIQKLKADAEKIYQHNQVSAEVTTGKKTEQDQLV